MDYDSEHPTRRAAIGTIGAGAATAVTALQALSTAPLAAGEPSAPAATNERSVPIVGMPVAQRGCL